MHNRILHVLAKPASEAGGSDPYASLLYTPMRSLGVRVDEFTPWRAFACSYDIFHLHWPEYYIAHPNPLKAYVGSILILSLVFWRRLWGTRVIWTVHNLMSHNRVRPRVEEAFWKLFTKNLDGYISLNRAGRELIPQRFPSMEDLPHAIIPSTYRGAYPMGIEGIEARRHLGISPKQTVFLFFGTIARYKGIPHLLEAFRNLTDPDSVLYLAGGVAHKDVELLLIEESKCDSRIRLHLSRVPDDELEIYFKASDLVVLPYFDIFNSGCALVALAFDRPVLVPSLGAMAELQEVAGSEWVSIYKGTLTVEHLQQAMEWALHAERPEHTPLDEYDWSKLAADTLCFYKAVLASRTADLSSSLPSVAGTRGVNTKVPERGERVTPAPQD